MITCTPSIVQVSGCGVEVDRPWSIFHYPTQYLVWSERTAQSKGLSDYRGPGEVTC